MTIKEVEQYLEVPRATIRFYEKEGLISPNKGENGYREYSTEDVAKLKKIIIFRKLGMALADIEDVLDGVKPLSEAVTDNILNLEKQMEELKGALSVCRRLQQEKEEIETFEADKYWTAPGPFPESSSGKCVRSSKKRRTTGPTAGNSSWHRATDRSAPRQSAYSESGGPCPCGCRPEGCTHSHGRRCQGSYASGARIP